MMTSSAQYPAVTYAIDAEDRLTQVDSEWERFAEENQGGDDLRPESVIGQSLWTFIREPTLQALYRELIDRVRAGHGPVEFDFRCDSPQFRRRMRMRMVSRGDGIVQFRSVTRAIEARAEKLHATTVFRGATQIVRCSVCNRYRLPSGEWAEVAEAVTSGSPLDQDRPPNLLWSVCVTCSDRLKTAG